MEDDNLTASQSGHGPKRDHHFIPQMYLRAFADPSSKQGELWRYGPGFKPQLKAPKGIAWQDFFYDVADELPPEDNDIEDFYAETETIAAPRLEKVRAGIITLTPQEKSELASFIALLKTRTRAYRESINTIASKMQTLAAKETLESERGVEDLIERGVKLGVKRHDTQEVRDALRAVIDGNVIIEQKSKAWTIKQALARSQDLEKLLESMNWNLFEVIGDDAFITSDNPVVMNDPVGRVKGPRNYRPSKMTQLHFPVSPKYLLMGDFLGPNETVRKLTAATFMTFQRNQILSAHKEVYASFDSDELQALVDKIFKEKPPLVPDLPADLLKRGR
jgi:hypothetical protein